MFILKSFVERGIRRMFPLKFSGVSITDKTQSESVVLRPSDDTLTPTLDIH